MVITCQSCLYMFSGSMFYDELGWHTICPQCGASFDVPVPQGRIVMAFAEEGNANRSFVENIYDAAIKSYYAFDTPEDFIRAWKKMVEEPDGMWYFVLDNGEQIISGACDEVDADYIEEHFGIPVWEDGDEFDVADPPEKQELSVGIVGNATSREEKIKAAEQCLIDNGIEPDEAATVLQAIGQILMDEELYSNAKHHNISFSFCEEQVNIYVDVIDQRSAHAFNVLLDTLEDSIPSYLDRVDEWQCEQLVRENLDALGLHYSIRGMPERTFKI